MSDQEQGGIAVITVPPSHAAKVQEFANSLLEEQTPEVEGYAALVKGVGDIGGGMRPSVGSMSGPVINALSGSDCSVTGPKFKPNDFECGDED